MTGELVMLVTSAGRAVEVRRRSGGIWRTEPVADSSATHALSRLAHDTDGWVAWTDQRFESLLSDVLGWPALVRHDLEVLHAGSIDRPDIACASLAYLDFDSLYFFPPVQTRRAPMWFVSSVAGVTRAAVLRAVGLDPAFDNFGAALIDFGGRGVRAGVCTYAEPRLITANFPSSVPDDQRTRLSNRDVAHLGRRLYGRKWTLFWLGNRLIFEHRLPLVAAGRAWLKPPPRSVDDAALRRLQPALRDTDSSARVDVVVPTRGRPKSLRNLLDDFALQTHMPACIAIVEQQPEGAASELDELSRETWPFAVAHQCVEWAGACRARNLGLEQSDGDWVLLLDDDVRVSPRFVAYALSVADAYGADAVTAQVDSPGRLQRDNTGDVQFAAVFPSGAALVSRAAVNAAGGFDLRLEGGWGEDFDYGIRLRKAGMNVVRAPGEPVLHMHESIGGFRSPLRLPWEQDALQPRPAPTILLARRGLPEPMQRSYGLIYGLKRLASVPWYRAPSELLATLRQWRCAMAWADRLPQSGSR